MCSMFDQIWFWVKIKVQGLTLYELGPLPSLITTMYHFNKLTSFRMAQQMGYSPLSIIALVYGPIFL